MSASDDAEFTALRAGWRADVPADAPVDHAKAAKVLALMAGLLLTVLCQIWIGLTDLAAIAAFVISEVPLVTVVAREGTRCAPISMTWHRRFGCAPPTVPARGPAADGPSIANAARAGRTLIWKVVPVVEFLGQSSGVEFQIHLSLMMFRVVHVLASASASLS